MPVTQTGETLSPHQLAGLVAAARIDKTEDVDSYGALEAVSKTVLAAVSPRGLLLPVHNGKLTDTQTTVAVVYKGGQLLALSGPDPDGEHLFDMQVRVRGRRGDYFLWVSGPGEIEDTFGDTSGGTHLDFPLYGGTHLDFPLYARLKQDGGAKPPLSSRRRKELSEGAEWVRHLIAAQVKWGAIARLKDAGLLPSSRDPALPRT